MMGVGGRCSRGVVVATIWWCGMCDASYGKDAEGLVGARGFASRGGRGVPVTVDSVELRVLAETWHERCSTFMDAVFELLREKEDERSADDMLRGSGDPSFWFTEGYSAAVYGTEDPDFAELSVEERSEFVDGFEAGRTDGEGV